MEYTKMFESLVVFAVVLFVFLFTISLILGIFMKLSLKILGMMASPTYLGLYMLEDILESQMIFSNKRFFKLYTPKNWFQKAIMDFLAGTSFIFFILIIMDILQKIEKIHFSLTDNFEIYLVYGVFIIVIYIYGHLFGEKENKSGINKLANIKSIKEEE
jgi:hypothetical protein